jgi:molybdate transport system permease protein
MWIAGGVSLARQMTHALIALPLVLPPTVLGFYLLVGMGPLTAVGRAIIHVLGHPLSFTFTGLVIGSMVYSLPFATQPLIAGFRAVDRDLVETARVLGASRWHLLRRIILPLARGSLLVSGVLVFAHTLGEFGVVLMIGGDIPGVTQTLSIALYDRVQEARYADANHMALVLVALSFLGLLAVFARRRTPRRSELV